MLIADKITTYGWEAAIRGMRNPLASWDKSDSKYIGGNPIGHYKYVIGPHDLDLMRRLASAGDEHAKYLRYITVTMDITAPDYWFKEFSTYRIGVTENSTSTMHKLTAKPFTIDDFSHDHLDAWGVTDLDRICCILNNLRIKYLKYKNKSDWYQIIQLLPMSYNYKRTVILNYQVLSHMYKQRKGHKLDEWNAFCEVIKSLPYSELITGEETTMTNETQDACNCEVPDNMPNAKHDTGHCEVPETEPITEKEGELPCQLSLF